MFYGIEAIENFDPSCDVLNADVDGIIVKLYKNYHELIEGNKELIVYSSYSTYFQLMALKVVLDANTQEVIDKKIFQFPSL